MLLRPGNLPRGIDGSAAAAGRDGGAQALTQRALSIMAGQQRRLDPAPPAARAATVSSPSVPAPITSTARRAAGGAPAPRGARTPKGSAGGPPRPRRPRRAADAAGWGGPASRRTRPRAGRAIADQHPGAMPPSVARWHSAPAGRAAAAGLQTAHHAPDKRGLPRPAPPSSSMTPTTSWPRMAGKEANGERIGLALPVRRAVSLPQIPASSGRTRTQSRSGQRGDRVAGERQPRHPAARHRGEPMADQRAAPAGSGRMRRRAGPGREPAGHSCASQLIGTWRTIAARPAPGSRPGSRR